MGKIGRAFALFLIVLFILSLVVLPSATVKAQSKTIVVPNDYTTIQSAIDHANNGDTVFVKKGYYPETLVVNKSISVIGEDRNLTIIDGQEKPRSVIILEADNIVFSSFTLGNSRIQLPKDHGSSVTGGVGVEISRSPNIVYSNVYPYPQNITITDNTIVSCPVYGIEASLSFYDNISSNLIIGSSTLPSLFGSGTGITVKCLNSRIENNQFVNLASGITFDTKYIVLNPQTFDVEESNIIRGNQNVTLATVPNPFPSISPSPSPTVPELSLLAVLPLFLLTLVVGLMIKRRKFT